MTIFHTGNLVHGQARRRAIEAVQKAPQGYVVRITEPTRSLEQNAAMWPRLDAISKAMPNGRKQTTDEWKAIMMNASGVGKVRYLLDIEGNPFPIGYKSSVLKVSEFSELIEFIDWFMADNGIENKHKDKEQHNDKKI